MRPVTTAHTDRKEPAMRPYRRPHRCAACGRASATHYEWAHHGCETPFGARLNRLTNPGLPLLARLDAASTTFRALAAALAVFNDTLARDIAPVFRALTAALPPSSGTDPRTTARMVSSLARPATGHQAKDTPQP